MKRILLLTVVFIMMLGTSFSFAQADADNFYKSDWVKVETVSYTHLRRFLRLSLRLVNLYFSPPPFRTLRTVPFFLPEP